MKRIIICDFDSQKGLPFAAPSATTAWRMFFFVSFRFGGGDIVEHELTSLKWLTIDLSEHNIHGSDHGDNIGNEVTLGHEIQSSQMGETGGTDLAAVRTVASIRDQVNTYNSNTRQIVSGHS
jgi:hypothetical protein